VRRPSARCSLRRSLYLLATSLNRRCRLSCLPCLLPSVRLRLPSRALACCRPSCLYSSPPSGWTCPLSCHDLPRSPLPLPAPLLQRRPSPVGASSLVGHHRYCCCPDPLLSCLLHCRHSPRRPRHLLVKSITSTTRALADRACSLRRRIMGCPHYRSVQMPLLSHPASIPTPCLCHVS
jgi:hypothetical protein